MLYLDSGTLTPLLNSLESKGFVKRERSRSDERVLIVTLTDGGKALKERAIHVPAAMASCVPLETEETQNLYRLLYKMLSTLSED